MAIAAIDGNKVATTRSEKKGEIGDTFIIEDPREYRVRNPTFRLIEIMAVDLLIVKNTYYRLEGFDSSEAFEETWRALHRGHFTMGKIYFMHIFGRVIWRGNRHSDPGCIPGGITASIHGNAVIRRRAGEDSRS